MASSSGESETKEPDSGSTSSTSSEKSGKIVQDAAYYREYRRKKAEERKITGQKTRKMLRFDMMPEAQKEEIRSKRREYERKKTAERHAEGKKSYAQERIDKMTPEQKEKFLERRRERLRNSKLGILSKKLKQPPPPEQREEIIKATAVKPTEDQTAWFLHRQGYVTGSRIERLRSDKPNVEKIKEELLSKPRTGPLPKQMQRGIDLEPVAVE